MRLEERWDFASFHVVISCFILSLFPSLGIYGGVKNCSDYHKLLSFINGKIHHVRKFFHWKAANMIVTDAKKRIIFQKKPGDCSIPLRTFYPNQPVAHHNNL